MKSPLALSAGIVVLVANLWVLVGARHNRSEATGGTVELTERELRLPPLMGESTALALELDWAVGFPIEEGRPFPRWLSTEKLAELGFDCRVPVGSPSARDHYSSQPHRLVYLVLEFEGEAWRQAGPDGAKRRTHLFVIDAGRDPRRLRERYRDVNRCILMRGIVRIVWQDRDFERGTLLTRPRLLGSIVTVVPNQVFVPRPYTAMLQGLRGREDRIETEAESEPRFSVNVSWGRRYEPWVQEVRRLP